MGGDGSDLFARFSPAGSNRQARAFLQRRLVLFVKMMLVSIGVLILLVNGLYELYPITRPARASLINEIGLGAMLIGVGFWLVARRKEPYSAQLLLVFDLAGMLVISIGLLLSGILADDKDANSWSAFIWMSFSVFTRGLVVPSSWKRTALASTVGMSPALVGSALVEVVIPTAPLLVGAMVFCSIVITLSTLGSHVIYGLRAQVREAMQLGQYTILQKIGEGGMGTVYTARHAMLRRPTAIKLLRPERTDASTLERFQKEVQLTSELTHPNTVAIYDYGRSPDGLFYYAMEFLDGIDLERLVRNWGPQPWARVVHILRQISGSLEEAHERGLIHRDIKPSNVILCKRGGIPDIAKVLDFGLVKKLDEDDGLSRADVITGTPAYLSPESIVRPDSVGPRSDLYSLGVVGYFLVTGELLFSGETTVEICMHHVHTTPVAPSHRSDVDIPPAFESLLLQCLAKDPEDRPRSARELRLALVDIAQNGAWTEAQAGAWWEEFEKGRRAGAPSPKQSSIATVTVDIASRTDLDIAAIDAAAVDYNAQGA